MESIWIVAERITQPGNYCLKNDLTTPRRFDYHGEIFNPDNTVLAIKSSDAIIDLGGHSINAEAGGMIAVALKADAYRRMPSRVTIRNGGATARTNGGINLAFEEGSLLSDFEVIYGTPVSPGNAEKVFQQFRRNFPPKADHYPKTSFLIEKVKIRANTAGLIRHVGLVGVGMRGAANAIRNSTIEVTNGHAGIYLFGPNQVIENNIIIFKGKSLFESAAAIKLHQADGSIIRNNDIIIESTGDDAPKAAISLIDSKGVIAENNRIYGIKTLVHAWDDKSSLDERNNDFRSMLRRPGTEGEPGVH
jgi:hypothetical protein